MNMKNLGIIILVLFLAGVSFAYSGFTTEYYTNNYQPNYYYSTPYTYSYSYPSYTTTYSNYLYYPSYTTTYYPNYTNVYYPTRTYVNSYVYPVNNRSFSIYKNNNGWGISYSSGSICNIYGYC